VLNRLIHDNRLPGCSVKFCASRTGLTSRALARFVAVHESGIGTRLPNGDVRFHGESWRVSGLTSALIRLPSDREAPQRGNVVPGRDAHLAMHYDIGG
jgi:hypothetical protein